MLGILSSGQLLASTASANPNDARYGDGQYLSDVEPGRMTPAQLSRLFLGQPFQGRRFTHFIEMNVDGLAVRKGREHVFVVPGTLPLAVAGHVICSGEIQYQE